MSTISSLPGQTFLSLASGAPPPLRVKTKRIALGDLRLDGDSNPRAELDRDVVHDYVEKYAAGVEMPPLLVFFDGEVYWLVDGFHRWHAARKAKLEKLPCIIVKGTLESARWASYSQNQAHGQRRSNEDKRRAVLSALRHPKAASMTDAKIAEHVGVDPQTVAQHRTEVTQTTSSGISRTETRGNSRRVGKDSKSYPAARRRKKAPPAPDPVTEPEAAEAPAIPETPAEPSFSKDLGALIDAHRTKCGTLWCVICSVLENTLERARQERD